MGSTKRMILVALALLLAQTVSTVPAAAHGGGPALYCSAGALNNCTDTGDITTAEDVFRCEGEARVAASCFDQTTGETFPYCPFHHYEASKDEDHYLCGAESTQEVGHHS